MLFETTIVGSALNFTGGTARWCIGRLWNLLRHRPPKFGYKEYLYGPKKSKDWFDQTAHELNNRIIGMIILALLCSLLAHLSR